MTTRKVRIGSMEIGGGNPVAVQSMCSTKTKDVKKTVAQIRRLQEAGCEIIRCGIPDMESAAALSKIKKDIKIPLVADIHYDYKLALAAIEHGADKIRINPGNIGSVEKLEAVIKAAKKAGIAIRVGVNSGSLKENAAFKLTHRSGNGRADRMVASLMESLGFFEKNGFRDIVISLKSSDIITTIDAYKLAAKYTDCPMHIGITEAGTELGGIIKSSIGLGVLLYSGLGDTLRVSLTAEPEKEVYAAYRILGALNLRRRGVEIISCPTCARTEIDVIKLAHRVEEMTMNVDKSLKIAVMGCSVNGPGEAREADIGVAGGRGIGLIFKKGIIIKRVPKNDLLKVFGSELNKLLKSRD
ncbi:MAG: flavodoxin-dependent (E)-4-hydroxy-3-methylbut-2-enyl-diphosphate synthase [Spirochaetia bacterium]|nr:flavodoxin-dependent (E)-4-hydroxy-3-methylbut-2-enyl-diphosphate synthase [Spirochaetia bacterium]